jgi:hypothetical protein
MDNFQPITSAPVANRDDANMRVMLKHFGPAFPMVVEGQIYSWMDRLARDYQGAQWVLHELSNGGFWMHPKLPQLEVVCEGNRFGEVVSGEVAGLIACLFTFCYLAEVSKGDAAERFAEYYHRLRDYAYSRPERETIWRATD